VSLVRTRRPHTCRACSRQIAKGSDAYVTIEGEGRDSIRTYKHTVCPVPAMTPNDVAHTIDWTEAASNYARRDDER